MEGECELNKEGRREGGEEEERREGEEEQMRNYDYAYTLHGFMLCEFILR